jgi:hypothetical protein
LLPLPAWSGAYLERPGLEEPYVATGAKRFAERDWQELGRHRLQDLWNSGRESARQVLGTDFPLSPTAASHVENLLMQFERHDPDSYSFRYPISKKKGRTHPSLTNVNLRVLRENVRQAFDQLRNLVGFIDYYYDHKIESERSK